MPHSQIYTQRFMCGHPDEFIEVQSHEDNTTVHNLLSIDVYQKYVGKNCQEVSSKARCLRCAKQAKSTDDRDSSKGQEILRSVFMAGLSATSTIGDDTVPEDGFDCDTNNPIANPHPPVTEPEHKAHRTAMQAEASQRRGKLLDVPPRRVWNAPLQISHQTEAGDRRDNLGDAHRNKVSRRTELIRSLPKAALPTDRNKLKRSNAQHVRNLSGERIDRERTYSNTKNENRSKVKTNSSQTTDSSEMPPRKSRFKEHFEDKIDSNPILDKPERKAARPRTAVPSRSLLESFKGRSTTSSNEDMHLPELLTRNFRVLHLPGQNMPCPIEKKESDSDSPDWVCETFSAIEAGKMSMDDMANQVKGQRRLQWRLLARQAALVSTGYDIEKRRVNDELLRERVEKYCLHQRRSFKDMVAGARFQQLVATRACLHYVRTRLDGLTRSGLKLGEELEKGGCWIPWCVLQLVKDIYGSCC